MKPKPKPEPVVVKTICSLCDQPWEDHGDAPTMEDCIRLLKAELAKRPVQTWTINGYPSTGIYGGQGASLGAVTVAAGTNVIDANRWAIEHRDDEDPPDAAVGVPA